MSPQNYILTANHIKKQFSEPVPFTVLDDINMEISEGDFISIHGASGSGKSTLLYLLATLDTDFEGSLIINNTEIKKQTKSALADFRNKHIGFIFQSYYLLPEFNAIENVMLPSLKNTSLAKEELRSKAFKLLEDLEISKYANYPTYKLSGGQQQRIAIARSLINDPKIIFADEPTGSLDNKNSQLIFELLKSINKSYQTTMLIATHDEKIYKNSNISYEMIDGQLRL